MLENNMWEPFQLLIFIYMYVREKLYKNTLTISFEILGGFSHHGKKIF